MFKRLNRANLGQIDLREQEVLARVAASERLRLSENAMPTLEKRRSTLAEIAGQPRYCRAMVDLELKVMQLL